MGRMGQTDVTIAWATAGSDMIPGLWEFQRKREICLEKTGVIPFVDEEQKGQPVNDARGRSHSH
jgi:hypothetical protein